MKCNVLRLQMTHFDTYLNSVLPCARLEETKTTYMHHYVRQFGGFPLKKIYYVMYLSKLELNKSAT